MGVALPAVLAFAIHPITAEPVLWLAESFGYVLGNLTVILAVWNYLEYKRNKRAGWLALTILLSISATLSIEQYLPILCALALVYSFRSRWQRDPNSSWIPLSVAFLCVLVFLAFHFGAFEGTVARLSRVTDQPSTPTHDPGFFWKLAWWLILVPGSGFFSSALGWGWSILLDDWRLIVIVAVAVLATSLTITAPSSWRAPSRASLRESHLWLTLSGILVFVDLWVPFVITGKYGIASRNMVCSPPGTAGRSRCRAEHDYSASIRAQALSWGSNPHHRRIRCLEPDGQYKDASHVLQQLGPASQHNRGTPAEC